MSNEFQKRVYEMEVIPPTQVWEKLSTDLDQINADNIVASKILEGELIPPAKVWEKIKKTLFTEEKPVTEKKGIVIDFKRLAVAAIFIGIIAFAWFLFFNKGKTNPDIATTNTPSVQEKTNSSENKETIPQIVNPEVKDILANTNSLAATKKSPDKRSITSNQIAFTQTKHAVLPAVMANNNSVAIQDEKPRNKTFDQPIDDLSMIATDSHYVTMVNANGRMVRIPAHLAHLAPRLQDKPITEDYYEVLYGEGAFWKDKLNDWRLKLANSPVSSGDIFSNMVELLKSVEVSKDDPNGRGR